jgi:hypothetical protein
MAKKVIPPAPVEGAATETQTEIANTSAKAPRKPRSQAAQEIVTEAKAKVKEAVKLAKVVGLIDELGE